MSTRSIAMPSMALVLVFLVGLLPCSPTATLSPTSATTEPAPTAGQPTAVLTAPATPITGQPTTVPVAPATSTAGPLAPLASSSITQVWANEGGDKVTRDELRATQSGLGLAADPSAVHNSVWDGAVISLFGARNEVVSFNLVLEAPDTDATRVDVTLAELAGPGGARITTRPASADDDVFNYVGRNIELFYVRYLEIKGLSVDLAYGDYDERHIPARFRRPYEEETGEGTGTWADRPDHDKLYPDIAVPLELHAPFTVPAST
ncbi:MAG: hypothetical protein KJ734_01215, partial [Chloroflexi bacterium]|nr:hypothetical protein [Chloroflexota bacterium]